MTDEPLPTPATDEPDVEGHSVPRMMGMGQLTRPGTPAGSSGRAAAGETAEPDLPPLTRRFPRMRDGESRTPKR